MKSRVGFFLLLVCLIAGFMACRRNQPSLVDANRAPDTELWYAPPDSTEYQYLVHLYWRGVDPDGVAERFIWVITDTIHDTPALRWNPAERLIDYRRGRITTKTDSVFSFTAFREVSGIGVKQSRQAFHVAAIDDNGVIDPTPAAVEFVAAVEEFPTLGFNLWLRRAMIRQPGGQYIVKDTLIEYDPANLDTVGMFRPFAINYFGDTENGSIQAFKFFPISAGVTIDGEGVWTEIPDDEGVPKDTIRFFVNGSDQDNPDPPSYWHYPALKSGVFRFAASARDEAGAQSPVDATSFTEGVCQVVVNFDPETEISFIRNFYTKNDVKLEDTLNLSDAVPDTVPYKSWIEVNYIGWDSPYDSSLCADLQNKCITYQMSFVRRSERFPWAEGTSQWMPPDPVDTNPLGLPDSMSMNVGSVEYTVRARSVDEYGKPDGTPATAYVVGNHAPTLDTYGLRNHDGTFVNAPVGVDTLVWDWWNPADSTFGFFPNGYHFTKTFYFDVQATGHDHYKDPDGSGITSWFYEFRRAEDPMFPQKFARSDQWNLESTLDQVSHRFQVTFTWTSPFLDSLGNVVPPDFQADSVFANLPPWAERAYDFSIIGRDLASGMEFTQWVYHSGAPKLINAYGTGVLGRWSDEGRFRWYFAIRR